MREHDCLNQIYQPLYERSRQVMKVLCQHGYEVQLGFFNLHEVKVEGAYQTQYYPLPVIDISSGEIGFNIDGSFWVDLTVPKEKALLVDYKALTTKHEFQVYGAEEYLKDLYNSDMDLAGLKERISSSREKEFHINFPLSDGEEDHILELLGGL